MATRFSDGDMTTDVEVVHVGSELASTVGYEHGQVAVDGNRQPATGEDPRHPHLPAQAGRKEARMNEQEVREAFERLELSAKAQFELHPDYVLEMPQSGERIRGRDNMQAYKEAYPNPPTIQLRRVVGAGDVWVVEARSDYGDGQTYHVIDIVQYRDNKIWRETRYYAQPFQAPEWRAQWVEPMEQAATPAGPTA